MKKLLTLSFALFVSLTAFGQGSLRTVQTLDQLLAINPAAVAVSSNTVYAVLGRSTSLPYSTARTFRNWRGTALTTNIANVYPAVDGTQWVADDRTAVIQDSTWWTYFNNSADSTAALQDAINYQPKVLALTTDATITQLKITNAITIQGYGVTLYQFTNGISTNFIQIASNTPNVRFQGLTLDGRNQAARGIRVDQNTSGGVEQVTFKNFQEFNTPGKIMACAFYVNGGDTYWTFDDCIFQDITGLPDGVIASGTGFSHGVYINREFGSASGVNKPKGIYFQRCRFYRILPGEDSDAIRWTDSGWTYQDSQVSAENCYFEDIGKRAFKASGSGGRFVNNTITNSFDGSFQATGWFDVNNYKEQYSVVSLYGRNHVVTGNKFNGGRIRHFFDTTVEAGNVELGNNIFTLSTNWGLNGTVATNSGFGTMFGSIYTSSDIKIHDNVADAVQFGVQVFSASTNLTLANNKFRNPVGLTTYAGIGWGRGIRLGRYGTSPPYTAGAVANTIIVGNSFDGFAGDVDISETTNTLIAANLGNGSSINLIINKTDPDGGSWPADNQLSGGIYGPIETFRPVKLWATNSEVVNTQWASQTNFHRRGQLLYDTKQHGLSTYDGRKWSSVFGSTKKYQTGGITTNTWYRVASAKTTSYGNRGSAKITIGAGGGLSTASSTFDVNVNYSDAQILMGRSFAYTSGSNMPISAVRVIRDSDNNLMYFDFQPTAPLTSLVSVDVQPDWTTLAGMESTNAWEAVQFTDVGTSLSGGQVQTAAISNVTAKVLAYTGDQWNWWFGPDKFVFGETPLARFALSNSVPTTSHTPVFLLVDGAMNQMMRDSTSGVFYASTYKQPHQVIGWGMGLTNSGTNVTASIAAGTNIVLTTAGNTITINSSAASSVTYTNGVTNSAGVVQAALAAGANVTFSTNAGMITIASTGGGTGPTNGSAVYVDGTGASVANFVDSAELNPTYSGTNVTYAIVANSLATNKIDSTFYSWINGKQSSLTFSTGTTNSGGTVTAALAPGSGVTFSTNANTITIASTGTSYSFTNGVTNSAGVVQAALIAGSNITLSTNAGAITISSTGGGGSTNGSSVFVDGVYQSAPNFADSSELNVSVSGTNASYNIIANSIATNKIDSTFYNFINGKQSALTFSTGTTNSGGTVTAALAAGTNVVFTTNANTITVNAVSTNSGGTTYTFLTGLTNYSTTNVSVNLAAGTNVVFTTNGTQITINAAASSGGTTGQTAQVYKVLGTAMFNWSNTGAHTGTMNSYTNTGVITNYTANVGGSSDPLLITFDLSGVTTTNYVVSLDSDATSAVWGNVYWIEDTYRKTNQFKLGIGSAGGSVTFTGSGYTQRVTIYELATVGGSSIVASNLTKTLMHWSAREYIPDAANAATFSSRSVGGSLIPSITFDPATQQGTSFEGVMPDEEMNLANGVAVKLFWSTPLASAGSNVVWSVTVTNLCCGNTANSTVLTTNAPSGVANEITNSVVLLPALTSLTTNGMVKVFVARVAGSASDVNPLTNELRAVKLYLP